MSIKILSPPGHAALLSCLLFSGIAFADPLAGSVILGSGGTFDLYEGVTNTLTVTGFLDLTFGLPIISGDVVLCEPGTISCNSSHVASWSDVVVFDDGLFQSTATIYSDDDGSLASLLSGGFHPGPNTAYLTEAISGITNYDPSSLGIDVDYRIHSPESGSSLPEPSSMMVFGALGVAGVFARRRTA